MPIYEEVSMTKELGKELEEMCNLSQYIKEEGILQGRKEGRKENESRRF